MKGKKSAGAERRRVDELSDALDACRADLDAAKAAHRVETQELRADLQAAHQTTVAVRRSAAEEARLAVAEETRAEVDRWQAKAEQWRSDHEQLKRQHERLFEAALTYVAAKEHVANGVAFELLLSWIEGRRVIVSDWVSANPRMAEALNAKHFHGMAKIESIIADSDYMKLQEPNPDQPADLTRARPGLTAFTRAAGRPGGRQDDATHHVTASA